MYLCLLFNRYLEAAKKFRRFAFAYFVEEIRVFLSFIVSGF